MGSAAICGGALACRHLLAPVVRLLQRSDGRFVAPEPIRGQSEYLLHCGDRRRFLCDRGGNPSRLVETFTVECLRRLRKPHRQSLTALPAEHVDQLGTDIGIERLHLTLRALDRGPAFRRSRGDVAHRPFVDPFLGHPFVGPATIGFGIARRARPTATLVDLCGPLLCRSQRLVEIITPLWRELVATARSSIARSAGPSTALTTAATARAAPFAAPAIRPTLV